MLNGDQKVPLKLLLADEDKGWSEKLIGVERLGDILFEGTGEANGSGLSKFVF